MENQASPPHLPEGFKAGFVSLVGKPNAGKSTLMNRLVGERLAIITPKAQTTRQRIMGILTGDNFQIIYSDTPGIIQPKYTLQQNMMHFVSASLEDADVILWIVDAQLPPHDHTEISALLAKVNAPILLIINKIDLVSELDTVVQNWAAYTQLPPECIYPISALQGTHTEDLLAAILAQMPLHPPYFDQDDLTDKSERFFASEIVREKIFLQYHEEVPYASEVVIVEFKDKPEILVIRAEIWVERPTQKGILIGKSGDALKKLGTAARTELEKFFAKKVFLELHVKVEPDWRRNTAKLQRLGYTPNA